VGATAVAIGTTVEAVAETLGFSAGFDRVRIAGAVGTAALARPDRPRR
jgi:hypothetical protein